MTKITIILAVFAFVMIAGMTFTNVHAQVDPKRVTENNVQQVVEEHESRINALENWVASLQSWVDNILTRLGVVETSLTQEISDRQSGDAILQTNIDAETAARTSADTAELAARIADVDAEEAARMAGDNTLQDKIDFETSERITSVSYVLDQLVKEIGGRHAADQELQANIDAIGPHTTDTNAATECNAGEYLDGDGSCKTVPDGEVTVYVNSNTVSIPPNTFEFVLVNCNSGDIAISGGWSARQPNGGTQTSYVIAHNSVLISSGNPVGWQVVGKHSSNADQDLTAQVICLAG